MRSKGNSLTAFLFGSIALRGSSDKTVFPSCSDSYEKVWVYTVVTTAGVTGTTCSEKTIKLNLSTFVSGLKLAFATSADDFLNKLTFRQICEPFAESAMAYLRQCKHAGVYSDLALKMPSTLSGVEEVAFDFVAGIPLDRLSKEQKKAIEKLNKRLFRTENAKAVAGAESDKMETLEI